MYKVHIDSMIRLYKTKQEYASQEDYLFVF